MTLIVLLAVLVVVGLIMRKSRVGENFDNGMGSWESWFAKSKSRTFGIPVLVAVVTQLAGYLAFHSVRPVSSVYANLFFLLILYSFVHTIAGRKQTRFGLGLLFVTCLVGGLIGALPLLFGLVQ